MVHKGTLAAGIAVILIGIGTAFYSGAGGAARARDRTRDVNARLRTQARDTTSACSDRRRTCSFQTSQT